MKKILFVLILPLMFSCDKDSNDNNDNSQNNVTDGLWYFGGVNTYDYNGELTSVSSYSDTAVLTWAFGSPPYCAFECYVDFQSNNDNSNLLAIVHELGKSGGVCVYQGSGPGLLNSYPNANGENGIYELISENHYRRYERRQNANGAWGNAIFDLKIYGDSIVETIHTPYSEGFNVQTYVAQWWLRQ